MTTIMTMTMMIITMMTTIITDLRLKSVYRFHSVQKKKLSIRSSLIWKTHKRAKKWLTFYKVFITCLLTKHLSIILEIETCNPVAPLYVPIFFWPATSEDSDGEQRCRDPFWLSLRHGGANVRIIVQTRSLPSKIDGIEKTAIQACIDHVIEGDTSVLGYVDADFQNRPMKGTFKIDIFNKIHVFFRYLERYSSLEHWIQSHDWNIFGSRWYHIERSKSGLPSLKNKRFRSRQYFRFWIDCVQPPKRFLWFLKKCMWLYLPFVLHCFVKFSR